MFTINTISNALYCITVFYLLSKFFDHLFYKKYSRSIYKFIYFLGCISLIMINLLEIPIANLSFCVFYSLIIGKFFYSTNNNKNYIFIVSLVIILAVVEEITIFFVLWLTNVFSISIIDKSNIKLFNTAIATIFIILTYRIVSPFFFKKDISWIQGKWVIIYLAVPIFSIINIFSIMSSFKDSKNEHEIILSIISTSFIVFLNIYIIDFLETVSRSNSLELQMETLKKQSEIQYNYYKKLQKNYELSRKLLHDTRNHLNTIKRMYQNSDYDEANQYEKKLYSEIDRYVMKKYTLNNALNIVINDKIETASKRKINLDINIDVDDGLEFISDYDIVVIFGNLLDNAIEACSYLTIVNKVISLNIKKYNDQLYFINICNPINKNNKQPGLGHEGLGLKNVQSSVEKYNGTMNIYNENEKFEVSIQLLSERND